MLLKVSKLKIFISYCHADEEFKNDLLKYIKPVVDSHDDVELWHDRLMLTGDKLTTTIEQELEKMTLMICLISSDYLSSEYCINVELKKAIDDNKIIKNNIFPIILRKCAWKHTIFGGLLAQPKDGTPVKTFEDKDDVYTEIADALAAVIKLLQSSMTVKKKN